MFQTFPTPAACSVGKHDHDNYHEYVQGWTLARPEIGTTHRSDARTLQSLSSGVEMTSAQTKGVPRYPLQRASYSAGILATVQRIGAVEYCPNTRGDLINGDLLGNHG